MSASSGEAWRELLQRLDVSDEEVSQLVARVCRKWKQSQLAPDELHGTIFGEVFFRLSKKYLEDPSMPYFTTPHQFKKGVMTTAENELKQWQERANTDQQRQQQLRTPETLEQMPPGDRGEDKWGDLLALISDCQGFCRALLGDADKNVQQVFLLKCEGTHANHKVPTGRAIARQLQVEETTISRLWKTATVHIQRKWEEKMAASEYLR
jgi:hypothetical protein